jgi:hypothetical protein
MSDLVPSNGELEPKEAEEEEEEGEEGGEVTDLSSRCVVSAVLILKVLLYSRAGWFETMDRR